MGLPGTINLLPTYQPPLPLYKAPPIGKNNSHTQTPPFSSPQPPKKPLGDMDPGEVVDEEEQVPRGARRREARRWERRQLAERILAARNRKDMQQFLEAFPLAPTLVMMISSTGKGGRKISILFRSLGRGGLGFSTHESALKFLC